jgi:hypothetical protein
LRRLDTEAHALRQAATKPLSPWCCSALRFHPTPSRVGRSGATAKPQDGSPHQFRRPLRRPKRSHPYGLPKEPFPPDLPRWVGRTTSVRLPDKWVKSQFRKLRLFALQPMRGGGRRADVVHAFFKRWCAGDSVRDSRSSFIEDDAARDLR